MSKDDYAKILIHAPTRLFLAFLACFGGGAGMLHFLDSGDDIGAVRAENEACRIALADIRGVAWQHQQDVAELITWSEKTLATLRPVERMGALDSAPPVFTFARGSISK